MGEAAAAAPCCTIAAITAACSQHHLARMHLFGSALRADFDLVMADAVRNRYVRADIEAKKQLIYQA